MLVFGEDNAIEALTEAIKMSRAGLGHEHKTCRLILVRRRRPTGVGKVTVQLSKRWVLSCCASVYPEYMGVATVSRLIGAPPGYYTSVSARGRAADGCGD